MALSDPNIVYGVHSVAPYSRKDGKFFGIAKVLASSDLNFSGELVQLNGGSNKWPFAIEDGLLTAEISLGFKEYPDFVFELFLGKAVTNNAAEATGNVTAIVDVNGTSTVDAATGIASVAATAADEGDLKFGKYVVEVITATTVDVYASTDLDFARGIDAEFETDLLKITASPITIPDTSGTVALPDFGLTFTGGSGSVAMTIGDTAEFFVRPVNDSSREVTIGATTDTRPEFGMLAYAALRADGSMFEFDLFRVKGIGLPIGLAENAFAEPEISAQAFYDAAKNAVFKMRQVKAPVC